MSVLSTAPGQGANNTAALTAEFAAGRTVVVDPGTYEFYGTSWDRRRLGSGRIVSNGAYGYPTNNHPSFTGQIVRFVQTRPGYPLLTLRGHGFQILGGGVEMVGDGISSAIVVEGGYSSTGFLATGFHEFERVWLQDWAYGFDVKKTFTDDDLSVKDDESHADNCTLTGCGFWNVGVGIRFNNQQAVNWIVKKPIFSGLPGGTGEMIGFDIQRGGGVYCYNPVVNLSRFTAFQVRDYSPNNSVLVFKDFVRDRFPTGTQYFKAIKYVGSYQGIWDMDLSGVIYAYLSTFPTNPALMFDVPSTLPRKNWKVSVSIK